MRFILFGIIVVAVLASLLAAALLPLMVGMVAPPTRKPWVDETIAEVKEKLSNFARNRKINIKRSFFLGLENIILTFYCSETLISRDEVRLGALIHGGIAILAAEREGRESIDADYLFLVWEERISPILRLERPHPPWKSWRTLVQARELILSEYPLLKDLIG